MNAGNFYSPDVLFMNTLFPESGEEHGQVVSMLVGPSVKPYFEDLTTFLQLNKENTLHGIVWHWRTCWTRIVGLDNGTYND